MKLITKLGTLLISTLLFFNVHAASNDARSFIGIPKPNNAQQQQTIKLVEDYFDALNKKDITIFRSILDQNVVNDGSFAAQPLKGIESFTQLLQNNYNSFNEERSHIVVLVSDNGKYAAAHWVENGVYVKDYPGFTVHAKQQKYCITGVNFFEIANNKIQRNTLYYDNADLMKQLSG